MRKHLCTAILLAAVIQQSALGQGFANAKYASEFLSLGVGARSAALGGAGTGFADDVTAGYFNPGGLSLVKYPQIAIFHESRFGGLSNYDYAAATLPIAFNQTVAISAFRIGYGDDIKDTRGALIDQNGNGVIDEDDRLDESKIKYGSASDWAFFGSYSRKIDEKLSVGGSLKVLHRAVLDNTAWGLGFDISASYKPVENLTVGAVLADATKSILTWDTGNQEFIVPALRVGGAYLLKLHENHSVMPVVDGTFRFEGRHETAQTDLGIASLDAKIGLEYSFKNRFYLRGGFNEVEQLSIGAGIRLPKLNIDYAFTNAGTELSGFGATHRISLMLTLEEEKYLRPAAPALDEPLGR